ncbi:MAG: class I SAM-dependent methyltransferase [Microcoleaceae cyanobacterium]
MSSQPNPTASGDTPTASKPAWAGTDWLSQIVNRLIQTKPLYAVMKRQARQVMIRTAEKNGIPWRAKVHHLEQLGLEQRLPEIVDLTVTYPDYYQKPFHAYDEGNLCWLAAFEAEAATQAMALRVWPQESISWQEAQHRLRSGFYQILASYCPSPRKILDVGCSVGISTQAIHQYFQTKRSGQEPVLQTTGLDLSPYMLAVAQVLDQNRMIQEWRHAQAENTQFPDSTFDLITLQFVIHELPRQATYSIFQEALRILRPGGCLGILDNNPQSPVIQSLPPALFTLMKSTEPWTDDYYTFDVPVALQRIGFDHKVTVVTDPRHRGLVAIKPE